MKHDILFQHDVGDAWHLNQRWVQEGFFANALFWENIREIHEVPEIVNPPARDQIALASNIHSLDDVFEKAFVHFLVIDKSHGFALAAVLQPFLQLLYQCRGDIVIDVYFGVAGDLEDPGLIGIIAEIGENVFEAVTDDIFQQDDMMLIRRWRGEDDEAAEGAAGDFDQGVLSLHAAVLTGKHHAQIDRFIAKEWELGDAFDHQRDDIGINFFFEIILYELLLGLVQTFFGDQEYLFLFQFATNAFPDGVEFFLLFENGILDLAKDLTGGQFHVHIDLGFSAAEFAHAFQGGDPNAEEFVHIV
jgi:hypothetical protein